jgi:hypothetical protein
MVLSLAIPVIELLLAVAVGLVVRRRLRAQLRPSINDRLDALREELQR